MATLVLPQPFAPRFDWPRIGALSGTMALHFFAITLLLIPPVAVKVLGPAPQTIIVDWFDPPPKPIEVPPPPIPVPIVHREIRKEKPLQAPTMPPPDVVADTTPLSFPAEHAPPAPDQGTFQPADTAPTAMAYLTRTPVPYPHDAAQRHEQGTVILRVLVSADGLPQTIEIEKSSGSRSLDNAARAAVARWTFQPGTLNGVRSALWARVPIAFTLQTL